MTYGDSFAADIEAEAGEPIIAAVIGAFGWGSFDSDSAGYGEHHSVARTQRGVVLDWAVARPLLDYPYDTGFGAPDCHAVTAWTDNYVLWVTQYDGSTSINRLPRNPIDHAPQMPGG